MWISHAQEWGHHRTHSSVCCQGMVLGTGAGLEDDLDPGAPSRGVQIGFAGSRPSLRQVPAEGAELVPRPLWILWSCWMWFFQALSPAGDRVWAGKSCVPLLWGQLLSWPGLAGQWGGTCHLACHHHCGTGAVLQSQAGAAGQGQHGHTRLGWE